MKSFIARSLPYGRRAIGFGVVGAMALAPLAASADPTPGLYYGVDWVAQTQLIGQTLQGQTSAMMPSLIGIMLIFLCISVGRRMWRKFVSG